MPVPLPPAIEIARRATLLPIADIAAQMGIGPDLLEPYGAHVAKASLDAVGVVWRLPLHAARANVGAGSSPWSAATCARWPGSRAVRRRSGSTSTRMATWWGLH
jgi:hypothetical protein